MHTVKAYAALKPSTPLVPFTIERRQTGAHDVQIEILYSGICHSDIHQVRNEWNKGVFPMVPGHEIVGKITEIGTEVQKFKAGDTVGVGCLVDSCRTCAPCKHNEEQYCTYPASYTYNSLEQDGKTQTYGGYAKQIVVNEDFVLKIPSNLPLDASAPLLCAGITTYSPLKHWNIGSGKRIAVLGLGGLGHMAVKIAAALGADVTVISRSEKKRADAEKFGAKDYIDSSRTAFLKKNTGKFDCILNTVGAVQDLTPYINMLKLKGTFVQVGLPDNNNHLNMGALIMGCRTLSGSLIGGIRETQEMLDFCGEHNIVSTIELIKPEQINEAYERTVKGDVRYRFVIDTQYL